MEQRKYWDSVSEQKEFTLPLQADRLACYVGKDGRILDVGCGYGRTLGELYGLGYRNLVGIDFSPGMIERGKRQFPQLDLRVKKDEAIDLPDESVPGGVLYVNDYLLGHDERNLQRYEAFAEKYGTYGVFELPEGAVCRHHSEEYIFRLLGGFAKKEYAPITFTTMNGHRADGSYYIGQK